MFCYNCGKEMADGMAFCPNCGTKFIKAAETLSIQAEPDEAALSKLNAEIEKSFPVSPDAFDKIVEKVKKKVIFLNF